MIYSPFPKVGTMVKPLCFLILSFMVLATTIAEARRYGGFEVGDQFKMKVTRVKSTRIEGFGGTPTRASIHGKVPKFRKGKVIQFRIKSRGRLTGRKIRIPYAHSKGNEVEFNLSKGGTISVTHNAAIIRKRGKASQCTLSYFVRDDSDEAMPVFYTVVYSLRAVR